MTTSIGKILVVDDEVELKNILVEALTSQGYETKGFTSGEEAIAALREQPFDILLTDLMMPAMDGITLLRAGLQIDPNLIGIMMTGQGTIQTAVDAMKVGTFDYVLKPFRIQTMLPMLTRAMNTRHLRLENVQLREAIAIHELSETIAFTLDPQTVLSKLADAALQQSEADEVSVLLPVGDSQEFYVAAVRGEKRERLLGERVPFGKSISSWVARQHEPVIVNGEVNDDRFVALWPRPDIRSSVSVPMLVARKLVGVLNLNVVDRPRPFTLGQMKALTILAGTAAAALESASLYTQVQQAEKNYRSIFENAVEGIFQSTLDDRFMTANPATARILGYESPEELIAAITDAGKQIYVDPDARTEAGRLQSEFGVLQGFEFEAYRNHGEKIWLSLNRRSVRDSNGVELYREGTIEEITDRKVAEAAMRESEERYRMLFESSPQPMWVYDVETLGFLAVNEAVVRHYGYSKEEFLAMSIKDIRSPETVSALLENIATLEAGLNSAGIWTHRKKDGCNIQVEITSHVLTFAGRRAELVLANDVTDRRRHEEMRMRRAAQVALRGDISSALAESNIPLTGVLDRCTQAMVEHLGAAFARIWTLNKDEDVLELQASSGIYTHLDGAHARVPVGMFKIGLIAQEREPHITNSVQYDPRVSDKEWAKQNGMVAFAGYPLVVDDRLVGVMAMFARQNLVEDTLDSLASVADLISQGIERKRAEAERTALAVEIERQRERLNNILAFVPGVVWEAWGKPDAATQHVDFISNYVERMLGYSVAEWLSTPNFWLSIVHPDDYERSARIAAEAYADGTGTGTCMEFRWLRKDGSSLWVESNFVVIRDEAGKPLGLRGVNTDISERKRAEEALKQSEYKLAEAQRLAHIGSWNFDLENNVLSWSDEHFRIFGLQPGEIDVKYEDVILDFIHPEDRDLVRSSVANTTETTEPFDFYYRIITREGEERVIQSAGSIEINEGGKPIRMFGTAQDVTERHRIEQELRQSEERYRDLVENAHDLIYEHDLKGNYTAANNAGQRLTGYSLEESLKLNLKQTVAPEYLEKAQEMMRQKLAGEKSTAYELELIAKDGHHLMVEVNTRLVLKDGVPVGIQGIARDITERRRAEEALRESETRKRAILESSMDCIITMDQQGRVVEWNPAAETTFGYSQEETIGESMAEFIIPQRFRERHNQGIAHYLATGEARVLGKRLELEAQRRDGTEFPIELTITRIQSQGALMFTGYLRDITARKKAEGRLAAQYAVTSALAESNTISEGATKILQAVCESLGWEYGALWTLDREANVLRCSQVWQAPGAEVDEFASVSRQSVFASGVGLPGRVWSESVPVWLADVTQDPNFRRAAIAARAGLHGACAFPIWLRSEILGVVEFVSRSIRESDPELLAMMVTIGSQIGQFMERKRVETALDASEEQLRQSQKLEAIGQLAGGVAHDFNNLLTAINGYSALALRRLGNDHPISSYLEEIKKAGDRAANLTRQLLAFGRKQLLQPLALNVNDILSDMIKLLKRLIGEDIQLITKPGANLKQIKADPGQLEQVLVNLVVNARDAMPRGGTMTIETANMTLDGTYANKHLGVSAGEYVMLAISDTGVGMDQETQSRIFEPFFTTKEKGKGTGLGLSTVYGIIRQSGGNIWVYSELGKGTTFKVYLPLVSDQPATQGGTMAAPIIERGAETVLLVEDEDLVRKLASELLADAGYTVLEANGGEEAIKLCKQHSEPIDLLITDVVMPKMSGKQVAEQLLALHPEAKVLFMSGYTDEAIVHHGVVDSDIAFIQKPFSERALAQKIREVLDAENGHK